MKVVLFCGGQGTRIRDYSATVPKPLVPVGGVPILRHVMAYYAAWGHADFVVCLGHQADAIRRWFEEPQAAPDGARVTFVEGPAALSIGGRLLQARRELEGEATFLATYADVLTDLDLDAMLARFAASDAAAAFCAVPPPYSFHLVEARADGRVERLATLREAGALMNGGYMALRPAVFDNLREGEDLVVEGFARLAAQGRLLAHRHDGFWMSMDTFREKQALDDMAAQGAAPWGRPGGDAGHARLKVA